MSLTTAPTSAAPTAAAPTSAAPTAAAPTTTVTRPAGSVRRATVVAGVVAAAASAAVAAAAHAAGVPLEIDGETIPLVGFAQMTLVGALVGGVLLAVLNRTSRAAGRRFLQTSVALTVLSCVPSIAWPDDTATKVALVATHLVAAAIVVPALLRHARS